MLWQSVIEGEQKYLLPHRDNADIKLNSYHPYELCIMRNLALPILESTEKEEYREKAEKLTEHLSLFFPATARRCQRIRCCVSSSARMNVYKITRGGV